MRKRLFATLLALCMVLMLLPGTALAVKSDTDIPYAVTGGNIYFDAATGTITYCDKSVTAAEIPSTINGVAVTSLGEEAFSACGNLTSMTIPDSVTNIGRSAFSRCNNLTSVNIPSSVNSIGNYAFAFCSGLTRATIPDSVTRIGDGVFKDCSNLTSVDISSSVTIIPYNAFFGCSGLTSVIIPSGVTRIEEGAFTSCSSLTNVIIPDSVYSIGDAAFASCNNLTNVTIPSGVTHIGLVAFYKSGNVTVDSENPQYSSDDGVLFDKAKTILMHYPISKNGAYVIPDSVYEIEDSAFEDCSGLTSVTISSSVRRIGPAAFFGCSGLTSVTIPSGVILDYAFDSCTSLVSVTIQSGVTWLHSEAFDNCTNLTSVTIPSSVICIENFTFGRCTNLSDVYYSGDANDWAKIGIGAGNSDLLNATIHYNSTGPDTGEKPEYKVYCGPGYPDGYEIFDVSLEKCMKNTASTTYNAQLAHMLMAMSYSVKSETNITKTFENFGFLPENIHTDYSLNEFLEAYGTAKKQVGNQTLVLVVLRGTEDGWEAVDDVVCYFNPVNNHHSGFEFVTKKLYDKVTGSDFLGATDLSRTTFVITGFSRGAAVANLLAARLVNEGAPQSNVFTYAFACPDTAKITKNLANEYQCIFNIGDVCDFISWSPSGSLEGIFSDWSKYGRSYWFSNDWDGFENLEMVLDFDNVHNEEKYLAYLRQEKSTTEYRKVTEAKEALDDAVQKRKKKEEERKKERRKAQLQNDLQTIRDLPLNGGDILSFPGLSMQCPVNVDIYSSDGLLVGSVKDNQVNEMNTNKVYISVFEDEKYVYLLDDDMYTLKMSGTDEGRMTYTVQNIDATTGNALEEQVFEQVALAPKKQFVSEVKVEEGIATDVETQEVKLYVLDGVGEPEKEVLPDGNGTEVPIGTPAVPDEPNAVYTISYDTTVISLNIRPMTTNAEGKLSRLPIPTRDGYTFDGWFTAAIGGAQITTETIFDRDTTVYAHWTYVGSGFNPGGPTTNPGNSGYYPSSGNNYTPPTYAITVLPPANGTIAVSPQFASKGSTVTITAIPNNGYQLETLTVSDSNGKAIDLTDKGNGKYTFTMPGDKITVNAVFQPVPQPAPEPEKPWSNPFTDITPGAWYYEAVRFVQENGLMGGYGDGIFAPSANLSRAMLAQTLYNKAGRPAIAGSAFTDVADGAWYSDAVSWAAAKGIVDGYGNGLFGPNDNITREQLAVMLWRYAGQPAANVEPSFSDADQINSFAQTAIRWAAENKILSGKGNNVLDPRGFATRAEVAQMLKNYLDT